MISATRETVLQKPSLAAPIESCKSSRVKWRALKVKEETESNKYYKFVTKIDNILMGSIEMGGILLCFAVDKKM